MFEHLEQKKEEEKPAGKPEAASPAFFPKQLSESMERLTGGRLSALLPPGHKSEEFDKRIKKLEEKGHKRGRRFSIIGIAGGSLLALGIMYLGYLLLMEITVLSGQAGNDAASIPDLRRSAEIKIILPVWKRCAEAAECAAVPGDCCACADAAGGRGINLKYADEWRRILARKCAAATCPAQEGCVPAQTDCKGGVCVLTE